MMPTPTPEPRFSFVVTTDMSHVSAREYIDYPNFFAGLLSYVKQYGPGDFMVSIGDVIPAPDTSWTIDQVLGEAYLWFPLPGNHDFGQAELSFLQNYNYDPNGAAEPNIVNWGPEPCNRTTYSFDYQNAHFVALNVYCNEEAPWGIDGNISDTIYHWLAADLEATEKEHIFVFGHEPAFPQPDAQTGTIRHLNESLDQYPEARDRFWQLMQEHNVIAYFNGHTHGYSAVHIDGVWQIDAGHALGTRAAPSPGTFLIVTVQGEEVTLETYRGEEGPGFSYLLSEDIRLAP
jgi:predicted phosphodiesterase